MVRRSGEARARATGGAEGIAESLQIVTVVALGVLRRRGTSTRRRAEAVV